MVEPNTDMKKKFATLWASSKGSSHYTEPESTKEPEAEIRHHLPRLASPNLLQLAKPDLLQITQPSKVVSPQAGEKVSKPQLHKT